MTGLLSDDLVMAYREPRSLLAGLGLGPHPTCRDDPNEVVRLAHVWDKEGLLRVSQLPRPYGSLVKVFNCKKSATVDRQIGDRRGQNSYECRVRGPSSDLPSGSDIMDLQVDVERQKVVVIISDRKDYYHQIFSTASRTSTNAVGPAVPLELLKDTDSYLQFGVLSSLTRRRHRLEAGDALHDFGAWHPGECSSVEPLPSGHAWVCFSGVEIATDAHQQWLKKFGLLDDDSRLLSSRCLRSNRLLQGLVIDDFFAASVEEKGCANEDSLASKCYKTSSEAYAAADLLGSPQKDVTGANSGKLIGAFVNSEPATLARGLCAVGAPPEKRVAISFITLSLCQLVATTDSLHLCLLGAWTSIVAAFVGLLCLCLTRPTSWWIRTMCPKMALR